ncbi:lysine-specific demethylase JMJ25-like [Carica papaya]|uniref:lysine-specific demethylase JMJ25-like n=1 Tax=Carica papaya TaxID=3649 RepID=UPI000B8D03B7|nr:lysine-specific demethylase JMJ25-like [Carica papaya]
MNHMCFSFYPSDNCRTSIVNFYRSCPNSNCAYDLCLTCCQELREGCQPGGNETETSCQHSAKRACAPITNRKENTNAKRTNHVRESQVGMPVDNSGVDSSCDFHDWRANLDGSILCPPQENGGCGTTVLELRRMFKANWVAKLIKNAEDMTSIYKPPEIDFSQGCSSCRLNSPDRQAAFRESSQDNFLYCPNAVDLTENEIEHFQWHWMRSEPVIVRNVLDNTSGLSWEPMVMWRAFRETGANTKFKEETRSVKAIDCLDWCEVSHIKVSLHSDFI